MAHFQKANKYVLQEVKLLKGNLYLIIITIITYLTINSNKFTLNKNLYGISNAGHIKWCAKYGFSTSGRANTAVLAHDRFHAPMLTTVYTQFTFKSQTHKEIEL